MSTTKCPAGTTTQSCKRLIFNIEDEAFLCPLTNELTNKIVLMKKQQFPKRGFRDKTGFRVCAL